MKQYRITSENFVLQGETGDADAVMDAQDLYQIKKLAGLVSEASVGGVPTTPMAAEDGIISPVGSNISKTAEDRNALIHKYHATPGSDLWFIINFTKPYLNGSIESKIQEYFKRHPEALPKQDPGT